MNVGASVVDEWRQRINGYNRFPQDGRLLHLMRNRRNGFAAFSGVRALNASHHGADMFCKKMFSIGVLSVKPCDDICSCPVRQDGGNCSSDFQLDARRNRPVDAEVFAVMDLGKKHFFGKFPGFQIISNIFHDGPGSRYWKQGRRDDPFRPLIIEVYRIVIANSRRIIHGPASVNDAGVFFEGCADKIRSQFHRISP